MWKDITRAIANTDPSSFIVGLSYGVLMCLVLAAYIALVVWLVNTKKQLAQVKRFELFSTGFGDQRDTPTSPNLHYIIWQTVWDSNPRNLSVRRISNPLV